MTATFKGPKMSLDQKWAYKITTGNGISFTW